MSTRKKIEDAAEETLQRLGKGTDITDLSLPVWKVDAELALESERQLFEQGDRAALLAAVRVCANHDLPLPPWASKAYILAYDKILNRRVGSWDEAFGRPFKKGKHLHTLRKHREMRSKVWLAVRRAVEKEGQVLDESLFEKIGKSFNLGKTQTSDLYYEAHRQVKWAYDETSSE